MKYLEAKALAEQQATQKKALQPDYENKALTGAPENKGAAKRSSGKKGEAAGTSEGSSGAGGESAGSTEKPAE